MLCVRLPTPEKLGIDPAKSEDFKVDVDGNVKSSVLIHLRPPSDCHWSSRQIMTGRLIASWKQDEVADKALGFLNRCFSSDDRICVQEYFFRQ